MTHLLDGQHMREVVLEPACPLVRVRSAGARTGVALAVHSEDGKHVVRVFRTGDVEGAPHLLLWRDAEPATLARKSKLFWAVFWDGYDHAANYVCAAC